METFRNPATQRDVRHKSHMHSQETTTGSLGGGQVLQPICDGLALRNYVLNTTKTCMSLRA
jgi:hypothetical protein